MAKEIRDSLTIIGMLERGELAASLSNEFDGLLQKLQDSSTPKTKAKGKLVLTINVEVQGASCTIEAAVDTKAPKEVRGATMFFITKDAKLSTEHPQQMSMFPRDADDVRHG